MNKPKILHTDTNSRKYKDDLKNVMLGMIKITLIQSECGSNKTAIHQERISLIFSHTVTNSRKKNSKRFFLCVCVCVCWEG